MASWDTIKSVVIRLSSWYERQRVFRRIRLVGTSTGVVNRGYSKELEDGSPADQSTEQCPQQP